MTEFLVSKYEEKISPECICFQLSTQEGSLYAREVLEVVKILYAVFGEGTLLYSKAFLQDDAYKYTSKDFEIYLKDDADISELSQYSFFDFFTPWCYDWTNDVVHFKDERYLAMAKLVL